MGPRTKKTIPPTSESAPSHAMFSYDEGSSGAPEVVRVWLLGGFRLSVGSRTIGQDAWRLRKAASLMKLLALAPGHRLHREREMDRRTRGVEEAAQRGVGPQGGARDPKESDRLGKEDE
jgi:hypothetical protein